MTKFRIVVVPPPGVGVERYFGKMAKDVAVPVDGLLASEVEKPYLVP